MDTLGTVMHNIIVLGQVVLQHGDDLNGSSRGSHHHQKVNLAMGEEGLHDNLSLVLVVSHKLGGASG